MKLAMQTLEEMKHISSKKKALFLNQTWSVIDRVSLGTRTSAGFGPVWADVRGTSPFCLRPGLGKANTMSLPSPKSNPTLGVTLTVKMARVIFFWSTMTDWFWSFFKVAFSIQWFPASRDRNPRKKNDNNLNYELHFQDCPSCFRTMPSLGP